MILTELKTLLSENEVARYYNKEKDICWIVVPSSNLLESEQLYHLIYEDIYEDIHNEIQYKGIFTLEEIVDIYL